MDANEALGKLRERALAGMANYFQRSTSVCFDALSSSISSSSSTLSSSSSSSSSLPSSSMSTDAIGLEHPALFMKYLKTIHRHEELPPNTMDNWLQNSSIPWKDSSSMSAFPASETEASLPSFNYVNEMLQSFFKIHRTKESQSDLEKQASQALMSDIIEAMVSWCFFAQRSGGGGNAMENVRTLLLESSVHTDASVRLQAFILLFNVSIRVQRILWKTQSGLPTTNISQEAPMRSPACTTTSTSKGSSTSNSNSSIAWVRKTLDEVYAPVQNALFHILVEMLEKILAVDRLFTSHVMNEAKLMVWKTAVACLFYFVTHRDQIMVHRLVSLDASLFLGLLQYTDVEVNLPLEYRLMELLVFWMYTRSACDLDSLGVQDFKKKKRNSSTSDEAYVASPTSTASSTSTSTSTSLRWPVHPVRDQPDQPVFKLSLQVLRHFGGVETFLYHFGKTHSLRVKRMLFMVFFDVAVEHLERQERQEQQQQQQQPLSSSLSSPSSLVMNSKTRSACPSNSWEAVYDVLCALDVGYVFATYPGNLTERSLPRFVAKLCMLTATSSIPEIMQDITRAQLTDVLKEIARITAIDDIYTHSTGLHAMIHQTKTSSSSIKKNNHLPSQEGSSEKILEKISTMLQSTVRDERSRGTRWLAELLTWGVESNSNHPLVTLEESAKPEDDLEETCIIDEKSELRSFAKGKFLDMARSSCLETRLSFVDILTLFIRRRNQFTNNIPRELLLQEINHCVKVLVECQESSPRIWVGVITLIFEVCVQPISFMHEKWLKVYDGKSKHSFYLDTPLYSTDSLAAVLLSGGATLHEKLLGEVNTKYFMYALQTLEKRLHPHESCGGSCCGTVKSLPGDILACLGLIVSKVCLDDRVFLPLGGMDAFLEYCESCDTRVALFMSKLVLNRLRRADQEQYQAALCDLLVTAQATGDEKLLENPYIQCRAMLTNYLRSATLST